MANTLRPGGGPGKGREPRRLSPFRGRRQLIPESRYQLLAAQPDPTYVHPPVRVGSIEAAHWASPRCHRRAPLPSLRSIGRLPAPMGGGEGRHIWSEFAAGSSRDRRFRGGNDGFGSRRRPASWGSGGSAGFIPRPRKAPVSQASAWAAGTSGRQRPCGAHPPAQREPGFERGWRKQFCSYPRGSGISYRVVQSVVLEFRCWPPVG